MPSAGGREPLLAVSSARSPQVLPLGTHTGNDWESAEDVKGIYRAPAIHSPQKCLQALFLLM